MENGTSLLEHEVGELWRGFLGVPGDDLLHRDVRSRQKPHEAHQTDEKVLHGDQRRQAFIVEHSDLQERREDQRQETAADRAHEGDDKVQLWDQYCQGTRDDDQRGSHQQVRGPLPALRDSGHDRRDEDLGRNVELKSKRDEDAKAVQELHQLVRPAVGQVERDAASDVLAEAQIPDGAQADVEERDDGHSHVKHQREPLRTLHLVLQRQHHSNAFEGKNSCPKEEWIIFGFSHVRKIHGRCDVREGVEVDEHEAGRHHEVSDEWQRS